MAVKIVRNETVITGITCGMRKDGSRCVLWDGDVFEWFGPAEFANTFNK